MTNPKFRSLPALVLLLCLLLNVAPSHAQRRQAAKDRPTAAAATGRPRLVVVIMVDQFRYDFLERFEDLFGKAGFRRLMDEGALFTNANFDYAPTFTAPGHAAVFTGSGPAQNGIVGNYWFDREAGKVRTIVNDTSAHVVTSKGLGAEAGAPSPRALIGTTLGDQMRLANNFQSKVVAVSFKDRSAVLPGGQRPNGAYWFDNSLGEFVSSDYYFKELPDWVRRFNSAERPDKYFGVKWERTLAADAYQRAQKDNLPVQKTVLGQSLPFTVTGGEDKPGPKFYNAFEMTPFAAEHLAGFARAAIEAESLGADRYADLLAVSFSSTDLIGHYYGPDSQQVLDTYIRLDKVIADFLSYLDKRVGLANTVIAITGDHGVSPVPEYVRSLGMSAERISREEVVSAVNRALKERFGDEKWVQALVGEQFYLDRKLMAEKRVLASEVERVAGEAAMTVPGIAGYFTRSQILDARMPGGLVARRIANGFHRERSGDVWLVTNPFSFLSEGTLATTHGSPYNYDTHVPVMLFGAQVRPGRYHVECTPSDIAPTLAALIGVEPPSTRAGRVLTEAIK